MNSLSIRLIGDNPYPTTVPDEILETIIREAVQNRIDEIVKGFATGEYPRDSVGIVVLDRTAPLFQATDDSVLFVASHGSLGERFIRNAAAKAFAHRDHGIETGALVKTMPGRLRDGDFRHGPSVELDGLYVALSGLDDLQDRYHSVALANELNFRIDTARLAWHANAPGVWFSDDNEPRSRYQDVVGLPGKELA